MVAHGHLPSGTQRCGSMLPFPLCAFERRNANQYDREQSPSGIQKAFCRGGDDVCSGIEIVPHGELRRAGMAELWRARSIGEAWT
eukprot:3381322-Rhodomonas_salina.1